MNVLYFFITANAGGPNLWEPHSMSSLNSIRVQHVASGPSACHSIIICEDGTAMSFGMYTLCIIIIVQLVYKSARQPSGPAGQSFSSVYSMKQLGVFLGVFLPPWMGC